jgi:hypothetical protein
MMEEVCENCSYWEELKGSFESGESTGRCGCDVSEHYDEFTYDQDTCIYFDPE